MRSAIDKTLYHKHLSEVRLKRAEGLESGGEVYLGGGSVSIARPLSKLSFLPLYPHSGLKAFKALRLLGSLGPNGLAAYWVREKPSGKNLLAIRLTEHFERD